MSADAIIATLREQLRPPSADDTFGGVDVMQAVQLFAGELSDDICDPREKQKLRDFVFSAEFLGATATDGPSDAVDPREVLMSITAYPGGEHAALIVDIIDWALSKLSAHEYAKRNDQRVPAAPPRGGYFHPVVLTRWLPSVAGFIGGSLLSAFVQRDGAEEFVAADAAKGPPQRGGGGGGSCGGRGCGHHHHNHHRHDGDDHDDEDDEDEDQDKKTTLRSPFWIASHWHELLTSSLMPFLRKIEAAAGGSCNNDFATLLFFVAQADLTARQFASNGEDVKLPSVDAILDVFRTERIDALRRRGAPANAVRPPPPPYQYSEAAGGRFVAPAEQREGAISEILRMLLEALRRTLSASSGAEVAPGAVTAEAVGQHILTFCSRLQRRKQLWMAPIPELVAAITEADDGNDDDDDDREVGQHLRLSVQQELAKRMERLRRDHDALEKLQFLDSEDMNSDADDQFAECTHHHDERDMLGARALRQATEQWPVLGVFATLVEMIGQPRSSSSRIPRIPPALSAAALFRDIVPFLTQPLRCPSLNAKAAALRLLHFLRRSMPRASIVLPRDETTMAQMDAVDEERGTHDENDDDADDGDDVKAAERRERALELELAKLKTGSANATDLLMSFSTQLFNHYFLLLQEVVNICAVCPSQHHRALALGVLTETVELFEGPVRSKMITSLIKLSPYPSIATTLLIALKEEIALEYAGLRKGPVTVTNASGNSVVYVPTTDFVNVRLLVVLRLACKEWLRMGKLLRQETYFEPLVASVNLFRHLIALDAQHPHLFTFGAAEVGGKAVVLTTSQKKSRGSAELGAFVLDVIEPLEAMLREGTGVSPMLAFSFEGAIEGLRKMIAR